MFFHYFNILVKPLALFVTHTAKIFRKFIQVTKQKMDSNADNALEILKGFKHIFNKLQQANLLLWSSLKNS